MQSLSEEHQAQELALVGLKWLEAQVLGACSEGPHSFQEICEKTRLDKAAVSRAIRRLTADGYLSRLDDPARRRSFFAELTPKGTATREQLFALAQARNERWLSVLDAKDAARFLVMADTPERQLRDMLTDEQLAPARALSKKARASAAHPSTLILSSNCTPRSTKCSKRRREGELATVTAVRRHRRIGPITGGVFGPD